MKPEYWQIGFLLLGAALAFVVTAFWRYRTRIEDESKKRADRIADLEKRMTIAETQVSPLWAAVQSKIAKDLTHPHLRFAEPDELLRQLETLTITSDGRQRLSELLDERINTDDPEVSDDEKTSARLMKDVMEKVIGEAAAAAAAAAAEEPI